MPWCEPCDRFFNPNTLTRQGHCPKCGFAVASGESLAVGATESEVDAEAEIAVGAVDQTGARTTAVSVESAKTAKSAKVPWHFKLLVLATGGYVGWRIVQLIARGIAALF